MPLTAQAEDKGVAHPVVVELFTSQGCSSCPPADALLARLADQPDMLALSYHVAYWNYLGWKDPYSSEDSTDRQRAYSWSLKSKRLYTPQMVIQGQHDVVGSDDAGVTHAIGKAGSEGLWIPVRVTHLDGKVDIVAEMYPRLDAELTLIRYRPRAANSIPGGENAGRTLEHRNVVTEIRKLGHWDGGMLKRSEPAAGDDKVAVLVQKRGSGAIIGGGWLQ